jgi:hypothetical protein
MSKGPKRRIRLVRAAFIALGLAGCSPVSPPGYEVRRLPSGREVRLQSIIPIRFQSGETALMLKYETLLRLEDTIQLRAEVLDIWSHFKADADRARVGSAIISANTVPSGFIVKSGKGYNFVFTRAADGSWHMQ